MTMWLVGEQHFFGYLMMYVEILTWHLYMNSVIVISDSDSGNLQGFHPSDIESEIDSTSHMGSDISDIDLDS